MWYAKQPRSNIYPSSRDVEEYPLEQNKAALPAAVGGVSSVRYPEEDMGGRVAGTY